MPLYFAYGSNMDAVAFATRCPHARLLGRARLARHRPELMAEGYLTVARDPAGTAHGALYDLPLSDIPALDRYEEIGKGLYVKITQAVLREGAGPAQALIYVGKGRGGPPGKPPAGYLEGVEQAAREHRPARPVCGALAGPADGRGPAGRAPGAFPRHQEARPHRSEGRDMTHQVPVFHAVAALRAQVAAWKKAGEKVALVPTMGALHAGHVSLVAAARAHASRVVVSIFVNPTQFAPTEDFGAYPRTLEADLEKLAAVKADGAFAPSVAEMYHKHAATTVTLAGPAAADLEDKFRPTHFAGVATIVAKLLNQAQADVALFGEKDYQQLKVIARMAEDLDIPTPHSRLSDRARGRRSGAVVAQRLPVAGGARQGADALSRHVRGGGRHRARQAGRGADRPCDRGGDESGFRRRLHRGAARGDIGASRFGCRRPGAHSRRREARQDAAHR